MNILHVFFMIAMLTLATYQLSHAQELHEQVNIGVLAHRGDDSSLRKWSLTTEYLEQKIPNRQFHLVPLDLNEMSTELEKGTLNFILTNPGNYVELERRFGATRIATLKNMHYGRPYKVFGAVIFTRADRKDIQQLSDLKNKSFAAVSKAAFGGFQMAWRELKDAGLNPFRDFSDLRFLGFPQDAIVEQVGNGSVDAGTVRTETIERMASEGLINLETFRILNIQQSDEYPFRHSTRLYPEWAFAKAKYTSDELAREVAISLMQMPHDHPATRVGDYSGWTVPLNYQPVHDLFMDLGIGPYQKEQITLQKVMDQYWYWFVLVLVTVMFGIFHVIRAERLVVQRTKELSQTNRVLEKEVIERQKAEEDSRRLLRENRFLIQKSLAIQEDERKHLARELHDELGQCITAIQADAETIQDLTGNCDARVGASTKAILEVSSRIYHVVHSMMQRLRPAILDDLGLVDTLREEVGAWQQRQPDTQCDLSITDDLPELGERLNITVYRIIQECLTNIAKHAGASNVSVHIELNEQYAGNESQPARLRLEILDDGKGMEIDSSHAGLGLIGIRERVEAMKGKFLLSSKLDQGSSIRIELPLSVNE